MTDATCAAAGSHELRGGGSRGVRAARSRAAEEENEYEPSRGSALLRRTPNCTLATKMSKVRRCRAEKHQKQKCVSRLDFSAPTLSPHPQLLLGPIRIYRVICSSFLHPRDYSLIKIGVFSLRAASVAVSWSRGGRSALGTGAPFCRPPSDGTACAARQPLTHHTAEIQYLVRLCGVTVRT
jgi:hypothetical protein